MKKVAQLKKTVFISNYFLLVRVKAKVKKEVGESATTNTAKHAKMAGNLFVAKNVL